MPDATRFYPVWVTNSAGRARGTGLVWGPPQDRLGDAKRLVVAEYDAGRATWGCVVRCDDGRKMALPETMRPTAEHWLELLAALEEDRS